jgi:hypothetical protein
VLRPSTCPEAEIDTFVALISLVEGSVINFIFCPSYPAPNDNPILPAAFTTIRSAVAEVIGSGDDGEKLPQLGDKLVYCTPYAIDEVVANDEDVAVSE